jgi:hypothetical protein
MWKFKHPATSRENIISRAIYVTFLSCEIPENKYNLGA